MRTVLVDAVALLIYPGLLTAAAAGVLGELAQARLFAGRVRARAVIRPLFVKPPATAVAAAVAGALAAAQLGAPFSPLDALDRNVLVAITCGAAIAWLGWAWTPGEAGSVVMAGVSGWAVALLAPAVVAQDLHPAALAALTVSAAVPAKLAAAVLYVVSLPALLDLAKGSRPQRLWLWLPAGCLFASVFMPPASDDALDLARFFGSAALAVAVALGLGRLAGASRAYPVLVVALTLVTAALAAVASFVH